MYISNLTRISHSLLFILSVSIFASCNQEGSNLKVDKQQMKEAEYDMDAIDHYTYAEPHDAVVTHLDLDIEVNFVNKKISGKAS